MTKSTTYDLSGGDEHIREIAEESGMEWEVTHSSEETEVINGFTIDTWYNEDASSPWNAWGASCKGYGSRTAASKEEAVEQLLTFIDQANSNDAGFGFNK